MNKEQFEGQWHQIKGKIKEKWGRLTDDELSQINGKFEQFIGKLQKVYGYNKERAEEEIRNWKYEHAGHTAGSTGHTAGSKGYTSGSKDDKGHTGESKREKTKMR